MGSIQISEERWRRVQEIYLTAVELVPSERAALLATACPDDPLIREEVESLLRVESTAEDAISGAIAAEAQVLLKDSFILGARLGDYRVLREIGRGGMGTVYLAERDDSQYCKQVAIKVVKRGMDTADMLGRFRHERQILANLDHPYISRLIDGGSTEDGRPFYVMDYVEGQPIDAYCRNRDLDIPARLRLFLLVCEAVSEAHRNLIVHRDLKPGNILVTADAVPKLLDFGVARLLTPEGDSKSPATAVLAGPLTPEYASPEQVVGLPVTTAIDVYALGAILYEVLTGARAHRIANRTLAELERVICQTEVIRPSSAGPPLRKRQLAGDLDNIVLMAMHKERERRYQSVDQLAQDIRLHLAGLPVLARQDSLSYRTWKYVRRHQWTIAAACLIAGSLIAGVTIARSQAHQAESARKLAESALRQAEREKARAESEAMIAKTERARSERRLTEMVELADRSLYDVDASIERLPGSIEARQRVVASTLQFLENLSRDAGADDRLRYVLSVAYSKVADVQGAPYRPNLGDRTGALANYAKSREWIAPLIAKEPDNPDYLLQFVRVRMKTGSLLAWEGEAARAAAILQGILPDSRRLALLRPRDSECRSQEAAVFSELATAYHGSDHERFLLYSREQVRLLVQVLNQFPGNREVKLGLAGAYSQLGQALYTRNLDFLSALEPYHRSIELREQVVAEYPADAVARRGLMISYSNLAGAFYRPDAPSLGDVASAAVYSQKAVSMARDLITSNANDRLAQYDLANALMRLGWLDRAPAEREASLATLREGEQILSRLLAAEPNSLLIAQPLSEIGLYEGNRLRDLGRYNEAAVAYRQSLDLANRFAIAHPKEPSVNLAALATERALAKLLALQGDRTAPDMALRAIERAKKLAATAPDRDRARSLVAAAYGNLGFVHKTLGNCSAASDAVAQAIAEWKDLAASGGKSTTENERKDAEALLRTCSELKF